MPTNSLLAASPNPIHQKRPSNVSENLAIMRSENGTSYVYKDSNGDESSFSTQGNKIFNVTSTAETKQLKKITGLDKNQ